MAKRGRPRKIASPEEFTDLVDAYVAQCVEIEKPITWTGMAMALGFYGRAELDAYGNYDGFSQPVKRAKSIVEHAYELRLHGASPTGAIFALKNMGWTDKTEHELTGKGGGPIATEFDPSKMSTAALKELLNARSEPAES